MDPFSKTVTLPRLLPEVRSEEVDFSSALLRVVLVRRRDNEEDDKDDDVEEEFDVDRTVLLQSPLAVVLVSPSLDFDF